MEDPDQARAGLFLLADGLVVLLLVAETYALWRGWMFSRFGWRRLRLIGWVAFYLVVLIPLDAVIAVGLGALLGEGGS